MTTPALELVECTNCDCLFAAASPDEVFYHGTARCRREAAATPAAAPESPLFVL